MAVRKVTVRNISAGSTFKVASLLAMLGFIAWMGACVLLYFALEQAGVVESVNSLIGGVGGDQVVDMKLAMTAAAASPTAAATRLRSSPQSGRCSSRSSPRG